MLFSNVIASLAVLGTASAAVIPRQTNAKMGISWPAQENDAAPVRAFFGPNSRVAWWYDWAMTWSNGVLPATPPGTVIPGEFVPMVWGVDMLNSFGLENGFSLVLGFNEPDNANTAVAAVVDPVVAAEKWREMVQRTRAINPNAQFASPAMAANRNWLVQFFAAICPNGLAGCEVAPNYVAVHAYHIQAADFIQDVQAYWDAFRLPLIVSEFACTTFGGPAPTQQQVYDFMGATTQWLDAQPFVYRYAWFGAMRNNALLYGVTPENKLLTEGGQLTPLGWQYVTGGHSPVNA